MRPARWIYAAVIALLTVSTAHAQKAKPQSWPKEPTAVFGMELGKPLGIQDLMPCDRNNGDEKPKIAFCTSSGYSSPYLIRGFPIPVFREGVLFTQDGTYDGVVMSLHIFGDQSDYAEIRSILIERYGQPTSRSNQPVTTKAGATFPSEKLQWSGRRISLTLEERNGRIDQTRVSFDDIAGLRKFSRENDEKTKGSASKM